MLSSAVPVYKNRDIASGEYRMAFGGDISALEKAFVDFMGQSCIEVKKHSKKKGETTVDIKPHIDFKGISNEEGFEVCVILPAGNEFNINGAVFTGAFLEYCREHSVCTELVCIKRTNIYCKNGENFV